MNNRIYLSAPHMGGKEMQNIDKAFSDNWIAPLGPFVDQFERDLCDFTGAGHAAALSSGTAALHLALILSGIGKGDTVIAPTFTFSATVNPVIYTGAEPFFVDSEESSWNISPALLKKAITQLRKNNVKPKAIIIVHLYGMPAAMDELMSIAAENNIPVIEDAAESLGSLYNGKHTGTFGTFGVLSFNGNKIITTSGGGALLSDDEAMIKKTRFLATQARDTAPHYQHSHIGYNYRLSNICAAIGCGQMEVLRQRIDARRKNFTFYKNAFKNNAAISLPDEPEGCYSNRWLSTIIIHPQKTRNKTTREDVRLKLESLNIESRPLWKPMHLQPVFASFKSEIDGTSEKLFNDGLCLPSSSSLTTETLVTISEVVNEMTFSNESN